RQGLDGEQRHEQQSGQVGAAALRHHRDAGDVVSRLRTFTLTAGAVVGTVCLVLALASVLFDIRFLVFRSGSMGPEIPAGSVALARPVAAAELADGDVVSVIASNGVRVTHRIVSITGDGAERVLTLRGDANTTPDAET